MSPQSVDHDCCHRWQCWVLVSVVHCRVCDHHHIARSSALFSAILGHMVITPIDREGITVSRTKNVNARIPPELLDTARRRYPGMTYSEIVRMALAELLDIPVPRMLTRQECGRIRHQTRLVEADQLFQDEGEDW